MAYDDPLSSDHVPIITTLSQRQGIYQSMRKRINWSLFNEATETFPSPQGLTVDEMSDNYLACVNQALEQALKSEPKPQRRPRPPWWTPEVSRSRAQRRQKYKLWGRWISDDNEKAYFQQVNDTKSLMQQQQQQFWETFCSSINRDTPLSTIWRMAKRMRRHDIPNAAWWTIVDRFSDGDPCEAARLFGEHWFPIQSTQQRQLPDLPTPPSRMTADYDVPFSNDELGNALKKTANKAPGPDGLTNEILNNLPSDHLLEIINRTWETGTLPQSWKDADVVPILKPLKPPSQITSYRPISLTSTLAKTAERMVKYRLESFLEASNILPPCSMGFRSGRSTQDCLIQVVNAAHATLLCKKRVTLLLLLDIHGAFDNVWREGLLHKVSALGISPKMHAWITDFLRNRRCRVKLGSHFSDWISTHRGVPQGSVLSPTLFNIMLMDLPNVITDPSVHTAIFADDVALWCSSNTLLGALHKIQAAVNSVAKWMDTWGFTLSPGKCSLLPFTRRRFDPDQYVVSINNIAVPTVKSARYLGITLDSKLSWTPHLTELFKATTRRRNLIRMVASQSWGANGKALTILYRTLIRPCYDYMAVPTISAQPGLASKIDLDARKSLRVVVGAIPGTSAMAIHAEAHEPPFQYRQTKLSLQYATRLAMSKPTHPPTQLLTKAKPRNIAPLKTKPAVPFERLRFLMQKTDLHPPPIANLALSDLTRPWLLKKPHIFLQCDVPISKTLPPVECKQEFLRTLQLRHSNSTLIYTDGSKDPQRRKTSAAFVAPSIPAQNAVLLPSYIPIASAELWAIRLALDYISVSPLLSNVTICSDSRSALQMLLRPLPPSGQHPLVAEILHKIHVYLSQKGSLTLQWVPAHVGVEGNELADTAAKEATSTLSTQVEIPNHARDFYPSISRAVSEQWIEDAYDYDPYYPQVPWILQSHRPPLHTLPRAQETLLHQLRMGRTRTRSVLHQMNQVTTPDCRYCTAPKETISHLLEHCPSLSQHRSQLEINIQSPATSTNLLYPDDMYVLTKVLDFLRSSGIMADLRYKR